MIAAKLYMLPVVKSAERDDPELFEGAVSHRWARAMEWYVPSLLALLFFGLALYGVNRTEVIDTDAARHAMNGAFIWDLVRTGNLLHPIEYGKLYYTRLPSLSIPFHPPLFPAIESIFFALFGVHLLTARLAVAVCVGLSAILLYRLVLATFSRPMMAAAVTVSTLSLWTFQFVARDVMLEFPSLVFALAALYCLRDIREAYPMRRAIPFAIFASAALWTKQHTVFLGAVPFFEAALARRWRRFLEWPIWVSSALYGVAVVGIVWFSRLFHGTGIDQISTSGDDVYYKFHRTLPHYFNWIRRDLWGMPGALLICAVAVYLWSKGWRDGKRLYLGLYAAWTLAVVAVLFELGPASPRYMFYVMPSVTAMTFAVLFDGCRRLWGERNAGIVVAVFAIGFFAAGLTIPFDFVRGPGAAARVVVEGKHTRVLYAGDADGNFVFGIRELDPDRKVSVIPAVKLPRKMLETATAAQLCRWFGIEWVVLENTPADRPWSGLKETLPVSFTLERSIPLESSRNRWKAGTIDVYRFGGDSQHPDRQLQFPVPKLNEDLPVKH